MLKSEKIITVSNFITNHITKNYNFTQTDKLHLIHRGVDIDLFKQSQKQLTNNNKYIKKWQIPQDKKIILMPGRITEWKGQDILIKALKQLSYHDYYCIIIGDSGKHPNFLHRLESLISANKLQSNITIKPNILDIELLYQLADIVVSASTRPEAFGRIMIEAGAMSKVMVATNHGGAMETIIDNETGFLAQHNNAEDLAKAINKALNLSKEAKEQMEKKAHLHIAQNFSITKMQQKTIALYNSLLN
jgi:glycosyltransferase involved in cell wall biosynthesis